LLVEKPYKLITNRPQLFQTIIENDIQRKLTKSSQVVNFAEHKRLHREHRDLMRAVEFATTRTKDKGTRI
jgi:hypothetical protein